MIATQVSIPEYKVNEKLYDGSRTVVYRGYREVDGKPVVIKLQKNPYPSFSELVQFRNQYTITKHLSLPGIIQTYSLEAYQNRYALVMEDFGGISLKEWRERVGERGMGESPETLIEFLQIAISLCDTLDILIRNRIVHKDIKSANILINPETKQVKLIDFSIASLLPRETQTLISPNVLEGTLSYLSPEQTGRMNRGIDYRTDFYSLGVTFYELLTGELPFQSDDAMELVYCHIAQQPPALRSKGKEIPQVLDNIVMKLMAKNAENRYQSALGLKYDLETCLQQLRDSGKIESFQIAQRDLCDRFIIPEKLYGREKEVAKLLAAFARVEEKRKAELMLVAGFSGTGKTAIINEVHKPIVRQHGYFIKGKFDQFNCNIPFSAFVQAFRDLMGQLLSEDDAQLSIWKNKILQALGDNGQVIIEVIPELESIIGKQPTVTELSGDAVQNRFNLFFQKFIKVFTRKEHPLVIFLDDLQWADSASLKLMQVLMSESENGHFLLIGAYRKNEVFASHPLILTLKKMSMANTEINTIILDALSQESLNQLVADTLTCPPEIAQPLTKLIYQKTKGNPFFSTQFLRALYEDGLIVFDLDARSWQWDIARVKTLALTDDVVQFMTLQLQKLPPATQEVLKLAACIGNNFDLETLAIVSERSQAETADVLWQALQEGFVLPGSDVYKFYIGQTQPENNSAFNNSSARILHGQTALTYKFLHDRVQQAAYGLIPVEWKQRTHLKIGQLLLQSTPHDALTANIFELVNHLNKGILLIESVKEKTELVRLNLLAGQKAKTSAAYKIALDYLNIGLNLLVEESWISEYDLTLNLHLEMIEICFLNTDLERAKQLADVTLKYAKALLDKIKVYDLAILSYSSQNHALKAIEITLNALNLLDIPLETEPPKDLVVKNLINLPVMANPNTLAAMRILSNAYTSAIMAEPNLLAKLAFTAVKLCLEFGNSVIAAVSYVFYGSVLVNSEDINSGYQFGELAVSLLSKFNSRSYYCIVHTMFNLVLRHWKEPIGETVQPLREAMNIGLESGDFYYASLCSKDRCTNLFLMGEPLDYVQQEQIESLELLQKLKQQYSIYYAGMWQQLVLNLRGLSANPYCLIGEGCDEVKLLPILQECGNQTLLFNFYLIKGILLYLLEDYENSVTYNSLAGEYIVASANMTTLPAYNFYSSLALVAQYPNVDLEQQQYLQQIQANQEKMRNWADHAPQNFRHKYYLVEAEQNRVLGQTYKAIEMYELAISGAKENGYTQEEALSNELAAKFYLGWGKEKVAQIYMQEAYYCYARWGAKAKIDDLEKRYLQLLKPILQHKELTSNSSDTIVKRTIHFSNQTSSHSSKTLYSALDFATILKATQALSSEIQLDKLLSTLMQVVMENAGAKKAALLILKNNTLMLEAIATANEGVNLPCVPYETSVDIPTTFINYVKRSLKTIVLDDATDQNDFIADPYLVQSQPKSLLCTPILNQGQLIGLLYLENQLTIGVFTRDRLEVIQILCAQAAIALENARLYQQAQQAQLQIVQSEKMSALGNLVAGVAHEMNNPLGFIAATLQQTQPMISDIKEHLELYQKYFPNPGEEIIKHAEEVDLDYSLEDLPKMIDIMIMACDRLKNISTSLRTFSRADKDYKVAFDIHEGIDSTILILKHRLKANEQRPEIQVITNYGNIPPIQCFPGQLNQVFMNILANAIDALDESNNGRSFVEIQADTNRITITTSMQDKKVKITIADNGKGMTEEVKQKIFDNLFSTKKVGKGTGLGLAISRQIVEEIHSGKLSCNSVVGKGTELIIEIPV